MLPIHYLDATAIEESATSSRLLLLFSYDENTPALQGLRFLGPGEATVSDIKPLLRVG